jgi:hypothetical protein
MAIKQQVKCAGPAQWRSNTEQVQPGLSQARLDEISQPDDG